MFNRRTFHRAAITAAALPWMNRQLLTAAEGKPPARILLRSSWQVVNIGDIAHTPGVLALLEKYLPNTEVRLWASGDLSPEVAEMEHKRFPKLKIVKGTIGASGNAKNANKSKQSDSPTGGDSESARASNQDLQEALDWCDFLLHGSGPSLVAQKDVAAFVKAYRKPFGVYGITYAGGNEDAAKLMSQAKFVYFRDSVSLQKARDEKIAAPIMDFAPDGAFACDLRSDAVARQWLDEHDLQPGKFACCIPRARNTPYWLIRENTKLDPVKQARNSEMFEHDMAPLRATIAKVVKETDLKVLICPEDRTQVQIGREWLFDKLPEDVRRRVVWRDKFWLTDEALSTYLQSAGLFGLEMHSPIMCIGNGIPAIVGRFAEQTSKGFMWRDIGLGDWLFDFDNEEEIARYPEAVLRMLTNRQASQEMVAAARAKVQQYQAATMKSILI